MKITDVVTITELSKLLNKSRPTIYKYLSDYEARKYDEIPSPVLVLFQEISNGKYGMKDIYTYCDNRFNSNNELVEIIEMIKKNVSKINLPRLKEYIEREIA